MKNEELALVFEDIADLLAIKGESVYRVNAYRRAAETLRDLGQEAEVLWREGRLTEVPGIGGAIAGKIDELLRSGRLEFYERLKEEVPSELLSLLQIPDVGPKKAALFWKELGITSVDALEAAAREGRLRRLPGMGARSEQRILENIEAWKRRQTGRVLLGRALPVAERFLDRLRDMPHVAAAEPAGSLRRMRETVGDLDLVVASEEPERVMQALAGFEEVERIRGMGATKASVELKEGLRMQVWVHPPERFGSAWQYATGSQAHNIRLREIALTQGLSLSEHGFRRERGEEVLCREEAEVYQVLALPWIPPELREDRGEIEAAQEGRLPRLVEESDLRGELHAHTDWSDGAAPILEMARAALALGMEYLVITDHSQSLGVASGLTPERLKEQRRAIEEAQEQLGTGLRLLQGAEVEILADGRLDFPDEVLAELDLVIASLHTSLRQPREQVTRRLLGAIQNPHVDVIGHPSGRLLGRREGADLDLEAVLRAAAEHQVALEINANPERLDLSDVMARRAMDLGCLLAVNTDAHRPEHFRLRRFGIGVARRGWVVKERVINAWPLEQLLEWLRARG